MKRRVTASYLSAVVTGCTSLMLGAANESRAAPFTGLRDGNPTSLQAVSPPTNNLSSAALPSKAMKNAMEIVRDRQLHCSVTNAVFRHGFSDQVEFSCNEGLGYIATRIGTDYSSTDCVTSQQNPTRCTLPENAQSALGLVQYFDEANVACKPVRARYIVAVNKDRITRFEVKCSSGEGYILDVPFYRIYGYADQLLHEPVLRSAAYSCLQEPQLCKWTSHHESVFGLYEAVEARLGETCDPEDARYVGHTLTEDADVYELKCHADRDSLLVTTSLTGNAIRVAPCTTAQLVGAECRLSSVNHR